MFTTAYVLFSLGVLSSLWFMGWFVKKIFPKLQFKYIPFILLASSILIFCIVPNPGGFSIFFDVAAGANIAFVSMGVHSMYKCIIRLLRTRNIKKKNKVYDIGVRISISEDRCNVKEV